MGEYDITYKVNADYDFYQRTLSDNVKFEYTELVFANMQIGGFSSKNKILSAVETPHIQLKYNLSTARSFSLFLIELTKIISSNIIVCLHLRGLVLIYKRLIN